MTHDTPTLVFIHGSGCTGAAFAQQTAAFPDSVALTLAGHATPGTPTTIAEMADDVVRQCSEREIAAAVFAGNSMGGAVALELALRQLPVVCGIVLIGSGAKLRVAPAIFEAMASDFPAAARMLAGYFFSPGGGRFAQGAVEQMLLVGREQTERDFHACDAFEVSARLPEIDVPLLALTGEFDVMTPPKYGAFVADRVRGASARIVAGAGHLAMVERPDDTNEALRAFVSTIVD